MKHIIHYSTTAHINGNIDFKNPTVASMAVMACGKQLVFSFAALTETGTDTPMPLDFWGPGGEWCPACVATELYKNDAISFEIGFEGNWREWRKHKVKSTP